MLTSFLTLGTSMCRWVGRMNKYFCPSILSSNEAELLSGTQRFSGIFAVQQPRMAVCEISTAGASPFSPLPKGTMSPSVKEGKLPAGPGLSYYMREGQLFSEASQTDVLQEVPYLNGTTITPIQNGCIYFETYGCQMNVNDMEIVLAIMNKAGYTEIVDKPEEADIIFINTCAIRENAEHKVWHRLNYFKHVKSKWNHNIKSNASRSQGPPKVAVLGCMAERLKENLLEANKMVDVVCGPDAYRDLPRLLASVDQGQTAVNTLLSLEETYADVTPVRISQNSVSAFVSIMRGCNNMCSYCIVPFTRGRERSRPVVSIVREVGELWDQGVKEVMLLGQNVNSYNDISGESLVGEVWKNTKELHCWKHSLGFSSICQTKEEGLRFSHLLDCLSARFPEMRFRFTSPHPKDFPDELLVLMHDRPNICKNIHLPAQSGSTKILEKMRRGYTRDAYLSLVERIRTILPDSSLSSDFIAGFCGETDEDHAETLSLIETVGYDMAYMFAYSVRKKTHAHRNYKDDVPDSVKKERLVQLIETFRRTTVPRYQSQIGTTQLVLVTGSNKRNPKELMGLSDKGHRVAFPNVQIPYADLNFAPSKGGRGQCMLGTHEMCSSDVTHGILASSVCMFPKPGDYVEVYITDTSAASLHGRPLAVTDLLSFFREKRAS